MATEPADDDVERHVRKRFEVCQRLGKGAYGVVWKAIERRSRSTVALKKCFDAFRNGTISASRGAAAPSRHRRALSLGEEVVGGFFLDFEAVRTESRDRDAPRRFIETRSMTLACSISTLRSCGMPTSCSEPKYPLVPMEPRSVWRLGW